LDSYVNFYIN